MSKLQFVYGNSGNGKSEFIYNKIINMSNQEPLRNFFVVVPDQFTLQTQKEFVERARNGVIMNVDVVSFARLAYRVFDELGVAPKVMEETGKCLVLRRIAEEKKDELTVLRGNVRKMGYINELKSIISELMQYDVTLDKLATLMEKEEIAPQLKYKLQDIATIYRSFDAYLQEGYVTAEQVLDVLCERASDSQLLKGAVFVFDGFTGFTPVQMKVLQELMHVAGDIYVTVTMDCKEALLKPAELQDLFYMSHHMIWQLVRAAEREQCVLEEPVVICASEHSRLSHVVALSHLERMLFRTEMESYPGETGDEIQICSLQNPKAELSYAISEISRLVRENGYSYKDFAIVCGDVEHYGNYADQLFTRADVPFFVDHKRSILYHPMVEMMRGAMEIAEENYSLTGVFRYLRSGMTGFTMDEIDLLENYCIAKGIRGSAKWKKDFTKVMRKHGRIQVEDEVLVQQLDQINGLRQRLWEQTQEFHSVFSKRRKSVTVTDMTTALYHLVESLDMEEKLNVQADELELQGRNILAGEYRQIYKILMDLLDKMVDLLGHEIMTVQEYTDILEAGLSSAAVGSVPPGADCVILGDIERTRLDDIKVLFFVGVNDGLIPKSNGSGGLLSQFDRESIRRCEMELAPSAKEEVFLQRFYLYLNLTKASEMLYVTYHRMDTEGKAAKPSYLIHVLEKLFPKMQVTVSSETEWYGITTPEGSVDAFIQGFLLAKNGQVLPEWNALYHWYSRHPEWQQLIGETMQAAFRDSYSGSLSKEVALELYGAHLVNSVTRIELYAKCAFSHFLDYGLGLSEREECAFNSMDMGTMFHEILKDYCCKVDASYHWMTITEEEQKAVLAEVMEHVVAEMPNDALTETARDRYMLERVYHIMERSVWAITQQIRGGSYLPYAYETAFRSSGSDMDLIGRVDRVDLYQEDDKLYVRVIDYKSGSRSLDLEELYYSKQLQLPIYMREMIVQLQERFPDKKVLPGGMFYQHLDDPMVEDAGADEASVEEAILKEMKLDGLVNISEAAYTAMDRGLEPGTGSVLIPVKLNRDGTMSANSNGATEQGFEILGTYVNQCVEQAAGEIISGEISISPYRRGNQDGCAYCVYRSVCGFDPRLPGHDYHKEVKLDKKGIWDRIVNQVEEQ